MTVAFKALVGRNLECLRFSEMYFMEVRGTIINSHFKGNGHEILKNVKVLCFIDLHSNSEAA